MLKDLVTGAEREVDICIEKDIAEHKVIISIECIDQARPADVGWIEKMKAKHDRLSTNLLALVSKSGFSKEANKVATIYGIETIRFDQNVEEESVSKIIGKLDTAWCKVFNLVPLKCLVEVEPVNSLPPETINTFPNNLVYLSNGNEICTMKDVVHYWLHMQNLIKKLYKEGKAIHKSFIFQGDIPSCNDGQRICIQKLEPKVLRPIKNIRVSGSIEICVSKIPLNQGKIGDVNVAWGSGMVISNQDALLVAFKRRGDSENITLTLKKNKGPTS